MKTRGFFAHESPIPGKRTPAARAAKAGTSVKTENIAQGGGAKGIFWMWFHSPVHHGSLASGGIRSIGVGEFEGYWTANFR